MNRLFKRPSNAKKAAIAYLTVWSNEAERCKIERKSKRRMVMEIKCSSLKQCEDMELFAWKHFLDTHVDFPEKNTYWLTITYPG